jgi:hypothetical protein
MFWNHNHTQEHQQVARPSFRPQLECLEERCLPDATQVLPLPSSSNIPSQQQIAANLAQNGIPVEILVNQVAIDQLAQTTIATQPLTTTRLVQIIQNQVEGHFDKAMEAETRLGLDVVKIGGALYFGQATPDRSAVTISNAMADANVQAETIAVNALDNKQTAAQDLAELEELEASGAVSMVQTEEAIGLSLLDALRQRALQSSMVIPALQQVLFGHPQSLQSTQSISTSGTGTTTGNTNTGSSGTGSAGGSNGQGGGGSHLTFASGTSGSTAGNGSGVGMFAGTGVLTLSK